MAKNDCSKVSLTIGAGAGVEESVRSALAEVGPVAVAQVPGVGARGVERVPVDDVPVRLDPLRL